MILLKRQYSKIWPFLMVDIYNGNLGVIGYWVIGAGCKINKDLELSPSSPNCSKHYWKLLPLLVCIDWSSLVTSCVVFQKIYSKMYIVSYTVILIVTSDSVNHRMAINTKTWITWERNIIFLWSKKILNLCLRWHILRSYRFVAEVTCISFVSRPLIMKLIRP